MANEGNPNTRFEKGDVAILCATFVAYGACVITLAGGLMMIVLRVQR